MSQTTVCCPVCAGTQTAPFAEARDVEYYTSDERFTYLQCQACRSVFLKDPPADRLSEIYPPNYYSYQSRDHRHTFTERVKEQLDSRFFGKLLSQIPGNDLHVLDVGGGSGWLLTLLREVSPRVKETHEVDIDENARRLAERAGHVFHCSPVEQFQARGSFDLILMLNLIEHVANPGAVLRAMSRLLSPRGLLVIKTPNVDTLDCRLFRRHNWGGFHCPRHFVLFNRQSMIDLGEKSGLRVVSARYTQGAPQWACSILGWMGLKGMIRISAEHPLYAHPLYPLACAASAAFDFARSPFMPTAQMFLVFRKGDAVPENPGGPQLSSQTQKRYSAC